MMTLVRSLALAAGTLLATPATAAILTVGPNGTFAEISDAIAAAAPNDVILVEPGTYGEIHVSIPLRILGDGTGDVTISTFGPPGITVTNLPAGELVVSGIDVHANAVLGPVVTSIDIRDCVGTIVLHDLEVDSLFQQPCLVAEDSERVMILDSRMVDGGAIGGSQAVLGLGTDLWIADSTIEGLMTSTGFIDQGSDAVRIVDAELHVWRSTITGGDASNGKPAFGITPHGGDGVDAVNATVTLYGGPAGASAITGGNGSPGSPFFGAPGDGGAAIRLAGTSSATVQAAIPLLGGANGDGSGSAPATDVDGTSALAFDPAIYPTLVTAAPFTAVGGAVTLQVDGTAGSIAVWFASFDVGPTLTIPGVLGVGTLNPSLFVQLAVTTTDGAGTSILPASVPPAASLLGTAFHFQAAEAAGAQIAITNPAVVVVAQ